MRHDSIDAYAHKSRFVGLDPRSKVVGFLAAAVATALLTDLMPVLCSLGLALVLLGLSGLPLRHILRHALPLLPFALFAFLAILPFRGPAAATVLLLRVLACEMYVVLLSSVTPFMDLMRALQALGLPSILLEMIVFLYRYIFVFQEESHRMSSARKARRFAGGRSILDRRGLDTISSSIGMILYRSYQRGLAVRQALVARGYGGRIKTLTEFSIGRCELAFLVAMGGAIAGLFIIQLEIL